METAHWEHVRGDTWCIRTSVTIPVYFLNGREVVLLDTGYASERELLDGCLGQKGVRVRAVLGSHSHWDHGGSHAYYQKTQGSEIILRDVEAAIVSDYALLRTAYGPATAADMARELPDMLVRADRTFSAGETRVDIDGRTFGLLPLPGHTPGHTGIVTPDGVLYAADAVMGPEAMAGAKLPSTMDWGQDLISKRRLKEECRGVCILAHDGVWEDIRPLADENIADRRRRLIQAAAWLAEGERWTAEEAARLLWRRYGLRSRRFLTQVIFRRNAQCMLEYLTRLGALERQFAEGVEAYVPAGSFSLPEI